MSSPPLDPLYCGAPTSLLWHPLMIISVQRRDLGRSDCSHLFKRSNTPQNRNKATPTVCFWFQGPVKYLPSNFCSNSQVHISPGPHGIFGGDPGAFIRFTSGVNESLQKANNPECIIVQAKGEEQAILSSLFKLQNDVYPEVQTGEIYKKFCWCASPIWTKMWTVYLYHWDSKVFSMSVNINAKRSGTINRLSTHVCFTYFRYRSWVTMAQMRCGSNQLSETIVLKHNYMNVVLCCVVILKPQHSGQQFEVAALQ